MKVYFSKVYFSKVYFPKVYFLKVCTPKFDFSKVYFCEMYPTCVSSKGRVQKNKLASLVATLVRNSAHLITDSLTGVKCRATSVAKKHD